MFHRVIISEPLVEPWVLLASVEKDWLDTELKNMLFTETCFLPVSFVGRFR